MLLLTVMYQKRPKYSLLPIIHNHPIKSMVCNFPQFSKIRTVGSQNLFISIT